MVAAIPVCLIPPYRDVPDSACHDTVAICMTVTGATTRAIVDGTVRTTDEYASTVHPKT